MPKLDRLARSVPDARAIADELKGRGVKLQIGATVHDPLDPMGKMFFNILATFAEFESDLIRMRTREGMAVARAKGKLKGKQPKLSNKRKRHLRQRDCRQTLYRDNGPARPFARHGQGADRARTDLNGQQGRSLQTLLVRTILPPSYRWS